MLLMKFFEDKMIYLDNSATTNKKPHRVISSFKKAIKKYSFNPGRGGHKGSVLAGLKVLEARETLARFFGAKSFDKVIFTKNCSEALNLAILGSIKKGGHIVTTYQEHNSVLRTLYFARKHLGITFSVAKPANKYISQLTTDDILSKVKNNTYLIVINQTSNVTGNTIDLEEIGSFCKKNKILFLVDSAQSAGHEIIQMQKQNINMLAVAGHKGLYGPQGIGALLINKARLRPVLFGGTGTASESLKQPLSMPDGFESGTIPTPNIIALKEGVSFVSKNMKKINTKISSLTSILIEELDGIEKVTLYSHNEKSGVVSFNIDGLSSSDVGNILNEKYHICVRCGLHCAPLVHKKFNTIKNGMIRVSISYFNHKSDIKKLVKAIRQIIYENFQNTQKHINFSKISIF